MEGAREQSCGLWPEIPACTDMSDRKHRRGGQTNFQCTISQDVSAVCLTVDVAEHSNRGLLGCDAM